jgi:antitoxin component of MazEF toxin-antitoxin module
MSQLSKYHASGESLMAMHVKVKKWGNSLAVLIHKQFAEMHDIEVGTVLDIDPVRIVRPRRRYKLSELLAHHKPRHRHGEWKLGAPAGKEPW